MKTTLPGFIPGVVWVLRQCPNRSDRDLWTSSLTTSAQRLGNVAQPAPGRSCKVPHCDCIKPHQSTSAQSSMARHHPAKHRNMCSMRPIDSGAIALSSRRIRGYFECRNSNARLSKHPAQFLTEHLSFQECVTESDRGSRG